VYKRLALGGALDPASLVPSPIRDPVVTAGELRSCVVYVDTFGNVKLAGLRVDLERAVGPLRPGDALELAVGAGSGPEGFEGAIRTTWQSTFGDVPVGETLVYEDSYGRICLAASQADAAAKHGISEDAPIVVRRG
jgi:S-adenosylmethionine hydrolase